MSATNAHIPHALPVQTRLQDGAYAIGPVIGQGGFGITYWGGDTKLGRYVAIKELFPAGCVRQSHIVQPGGNLSATDFAAIKARFLSEARALAQFRHPGIVHVNTLFEENNTAYIVMEYLKGKTLLQLVEDQGALPENVAVGYIQKVAEALEVLHSAKTLHRDINPSNIICCDDGRVVLIDFGLTQEIEEPVGGMGTRKLRATTHFGTEGYAPPEQYVSHAQTGTYTDIYALGATLYHLVTGKMPVAAPERMYGVAQPVAREVNPLVDTAVSELAQWAMQIKEKDRPQSVATFLIGLKATGRVSPTLMKPSPLSAPVTGTVAPTSLTLAPQAGSGSVTPKNPQQAPSVIPAGGSNPFVVTDVSSLQTAILQAMPGDAIRIQPGHYILSAPLTIRKSLSLEGEDREETFIKSAAQKCVVSLEGNHEWRFEGISFVHSGSDWADVVMVNGGKINFNKCAFSGGVLDDTRDDPPPFPGGRGIVVSGKTTGHVLACDFFNNVTGLELSGEADLKVDGNYLHGNDWSGISYEGNATGSANRNLCERGHNGIYLDGQSKPILENNHCQYCGSGICYQKRSGGIARNNKCVENTTGIYIDSTANPTLSNNVCQRNRKGDIVDARRRF